jgi:hypothetical protein
MVSQLTKRIYVALHSPHPYQRLRDLIISHTLFNLPVSVRKQLFTGQNHFCPICETFLNRIPNLASPLSSLVPDLSLASAASIGIPLFEAVRRR